ncbi:hypothetical protein GCM10025857_00560 [Alicyclobacillus contaminans]|nr:hypothetical protein GCM10025857_00560 [Alicyclobacillus contaminans]
MYDYSYHTDLVSEDADGFLRLSEGVQAWMTQSAKERQRALVRFYLSLYRRPIQRLPQIALLLAHTAHRWTASEAMFAALSDFVQPYYYDSPEQIWQIRILKMFRHLGLIRIGDDENGQTWFQITELGQQLLTPDALPGSQEQTAERQRILIVQPNFEIVVTADQPTVTANLSLFAELRQAGVLRIYRMTEESIRKGVAAGRSLQQWLTFLHNHSQTPVPGNVERTIEEWDRLWAASPDNPEEDTLTS